MLGLMSAAHSVRRSVGRRMKALGLSLRFPAAVAEGTVSPGPSPRASGLSNSLLTSHFPHRLLPPPQLKRRDCFPSRGHEARISVWAGLGPSLTAPPSHPASALSSWWLSLWRSAPCLLVRSSRPLVGVPSPYDLILTKYTDSDPVSWYGTSWPPLAAQLR